MGGFEYHHRGHLLSIKSLIEAEGGETAHIHGCKEPLVCQL